MLLYVGGIAGRRQQTLWSREPVEVRIDAVCDALARHPARKTVARARGRCFVFVNARQRARAMSMFLFSVNEACARAMCRFCERLAFCRGSCEAGACPIGAVPRWAARSHAEPVPARLIPLIGLDAKASCAACDAHRDRKANRDHDRRPQAHPSRRPATALRRTAPAAREERAAVRSGLRTAATRCWWLLGDFASGARRAAVQRPACAVPAARVDRARDHVRRAARVDQAEQLGHAGAAEHGADACQAPAARERARCSTTTIASRSRRRRRPPALTPSGGIVATSGGKNNVELAAPTGVASASCGRPTRHRAR